MLPQQMDSVDSPRLGDIDEGHSGPGNVRYPGQDDPYDLGQNEEFPARDDDDWLI